jgi:hypothetical protein
MRIGHGSSCDEPPPERVFHEGWFSDASENLARRTTCHDSPQSSDVAEAQATQRTACRFAFTPETGPNARSSRSWNVGPGF